MIKKSLLKFARKPLGLRNLVDYIESRDAMLGVVGLDIGTVIDVGANKGRLTRAYYRKFPQAQVIAIEPIPALYKELQAWANDKQDRVKIFNVAVAATTHETTFYINRRSTIWSSLKKPDAKYNGQFDTINVKVETLDNLAKQFELRGDVLLKIDTEGFDLEVIRGGHETLRKVTAINIESSFYPTGYGEGSPVFEDLVSALWELGFCYRGNIRAAFDRGVCGAVDALFVRRDAVSRLSAA